MAAFQLSEAIARIDAEAPKRSAEASKWYFESLHGSPAEKLQARFKRAGQLHSRGWRG